jgi:hypothetical protein
MYRVLVPGHSPICCDSLDEVWALVQRLVPTDQRLTAKCGRVYSYPGWMHRHERECARCRVLEEGASE